MKFSIIICMVLVILTSCGRGRDDYLPIGEPTFELLVDYNITSDDI